MVFLLPAGMWIWINFPGKLVSDHSLIFNAPEVFKSALTSFYTIQVKVKSEPVKELFPFQSECLLPEP